MELVDSDGELAANDWNGNGEAATDLRTRVRVAPELATVRTSQAILPEEPIATSGLLDLVGAVPRRALELGLAAREPSFHVFVAARPEVGIESDVVRYAERFAREHAGGTKTAPDLVYVHDFEHPEAPRALRRGGRAAAPLGSAGSSRVRAPRSFRPRA